MIALVYFAGVRVVFLVMLLLFLNSLRRREVPLHFLAVIEGLFSCLVLAWGWPLFLMLAVWLLYQDVKLQRRQQHIREG